jgi:hypothetical protein
MKRRLLRVGAVALCSMAFLAESSTLFAQQSQTFNFTGGIQTFTVPCGIDTVFVQSWGAQGGNGATGGNSATGGTGGLGGYAEGYLLVSPGDVLNVFVGGQGATPTGGFNGGANGGSQNAGGGGGASDVRIGGTSEANRVITAGGGGGSSYVGGLLNDVTNNGIWLGNGQVTISWTDLTPVASLITPQIEFCVGDTAVYAATSTNTATSFTWTVTGDLSIISGQGTNVIQVVGSGVTNAGTIEVYAEDANCSLVGPTTAAFTVLVNALPTVTANASANNLCVGESTTLTGGGTASTFTWNNGLNDGDVVTPANTTVYTVSGTDVNGCSSQASVTVTVNPLPVVALNGSLEGTVCGNQDITLTGTPAGGTYMVVSGTTSDLNGNIFNATSQGVYEIAYTYADGNGCTNADTLTYNINCMLGLEILGANGTISIYPNPSNRNFTINSGITISGTVELFDEMGRLVYAQAVSQMKNKQFEVKNLAPGIYNITITNGSDVYSGKLKVVK